MWGKLGSK